MDKLIATIPCIIVICYVVGLICKAIPNFSDKFIPVAVSIAGGILGVVGMYTIPEFPAHDVLNALAIGIASGLASTGANQIVKQLSQKVDMTDYTGIDYSDDMYWDDDEEEGGVPDGDK